ncbi:unnamed protein product [Victoria cruziana]
MGFRIDRGGIFILPLIMFLYFFAITNSIGRNLQGSFVFLLLVSVWSATGRRFRSWAASDVQNFFIWKSLHFKYGKFGDHVGKYVFWNCIE